MISLEKYSVIRAALEQRSFELNRSVRFLRIFTPEDNPEGVLRQTARLEEYAANITRLAKELRDAL